jgi:hypothetical protein
MPGSVTRELQLFERRERVSDATLFQAQVQDVKQLALEERLTNRATC